jgi:ABC-type transporter MlaC component
MCKIKIKLFVGEQEVDTLTKEQRQELSAKLGEAMSQYYSANLQEYEKIGDSNVQA